MCIARVEENQTDSTMLTQGARLLQQIRLSLQEFHTRAQRKRFTDKVDNIAALASALKEFLYKELANDASAADDPEMQERLRLISLGHTDIIEDVRSVF